MALRFQVSVHLGAHKTGSSYIQRALAENRSALKARGIAYLPLPAMRPTVTRAAVTGQAAAFAAAQEALAKATRARPLRRLILSDENLLGVPGSLLAGRGFYRSVADHVAFLTQALLDGAAPLFFLCIRAYDEFVVSLYSELLRNRPFLTFDEYLAQLDLAALSWPDMIGRLCGATAPERIVLWDFRLFRDDPATVFEALLDGARLPGLPANPIRPSLSAKAIEELAALRARLNDAEIGDCVREMSLRFPRSDYPAFEPLAPPMQAELQDRFARDFARIRADFPAIRVLAGAAGIGTA